MNVSPDVWRLIAENRIKEAIRQGEFAELPGYGQPLDLESADTSEHWWLKAKARRESLGVLPPALELARHVEKRLRVISGLNERADVICQIQKLNEFIDAANRKIMWGPPSTTVSVDLEKFLGQWNTGRPDG